MNLDLLPFAGQQVTLRFELSGGRIGLDSVLLTDFANPAYDFTGGLLP
jgi:hypothetical protein